jgi:hypothetical protein
MPRRSHPSCPSHRERSGRPALRESRTFSADEVRVERLILAEDMVHLVLEDGQTLPGPLQRQLRQLYEGLGAVRRQARHGP